MLNFNCKFFACSDAYRSIVFVRPYVRLSVCLLSLKRNLFDPMIGQVMDCLNFVCLLYAPTYNLGDNLVTSIAIHMSNRALYLDSLFD